MAEAMQEMLPESFLHVSSDHLVASGMLPARRDEHGPCAWQRIRPRFFAGFHRCLPALAAAGNDMIVDHVIEYRSWRYFTIPGGQVFTIATNELNAADEDGAGAGNRWLPSIQAVAAAHPAPSASAWPLWSLDRLTLRAWLG